MALQKITSSRVELPPIWLVENEEDYKNMVPMNRFGEPEEVAGVVAFLVGQDSTYVTGQVISVNGGLYS